jgi:hypothetical protein
MSSKRVYGSIVLQAFIGLFYALVMVGRVDNFLVDDIPLLEEGCIREFHRLKQANALNLTSAMQACPNASLVRVEDPYEGVHTLLVIRAGSDAGITLLFDKDGQLIGITGAPFHIRGGFYRGISTLTVFSLVLLPLIALVLVARSLDIPLVRSGALLSLGTLLAYWSGLTVDPLNPRLSLIVNGVVYGLALGAGVWAIVEVFRKRDAIRRAIFSEPEAGTISPQ